MRDQAHFLRLLEQGLVSESESYEPLEFLSDLIFDFTTYDSGVASTFATKAVEVCRAITEGTTWELIKRSDDDYLWYIALCNMSFFSKHIEWGTSIRGAWWEHGYHTTNPSGLWDDNGQVTNLVLHRDEWIAYIRAICEFAARATGGQGA